MAGVAVFLTENPMTVEEEGITMTSVLFCKHGGIIYPITSGQEQIKEVTISGLIAAEHLIGTGDLHKALSRKNMGKVGR